MEIKRKAAQICRPIWNPGNIDDEWLLLLVHVDILGFSPVELQTPITSSIWTRFQKELHEMNATRLLFHFLLAWCATDAYLRTYGNSTKSRPDFLPTNPESW